MEYITTTHFLTDMEKHDLEIYKITSVSLLHTDFTPAQLGFARIQFLWIFSN